jgi:predicted RNA-binding Zn-ribbon protein involved in translation (DUF1610 family)
MENEMTDIQDAEFTESTAIAVPQRAEVATWTPSFAVTVNNAIAMKEEKNRFFKSVMVADMHYGVIPGTGTKPTLYKPGAEMLLANMGLQAECSNELEPVLDYTGAIHGEPMIKYNRSCTIYRQTGPTQNERIVIAKASGSCSSWEPKYRYRNAALECPSCGKETIIRGKKEYGGGFLCFAKKGGCGAKFGDDAFANAVQGKVANPDVAELDNTILKMADKRALVAATLIATGCSDIFTQDIEDMSPAARGSSPPKPKEAPSLQSLMATAKAKRICEDTDSFRAWVTKNVVICDGLIKGQVPTKDQLLAIEEALK